LNSTVSRKLLTLCHMIILFTQMLLPTCWILICSCEIYASFAVLYQYETVLCMFKAMLFEYFLNEYIVFIASCFYKTQLWGSMLRTHTVLLLIPKIRNFALRKLKSCDDVILIVENIICVLVHLSHAACTCHNLLISCKWIFAEISYVTTASVNKVTKHSFCIHSCTRN
jgi:hypothetical protein